MLALPLVGVLLGEAASRLVLPPQSLFLRIAHESRAYFGVVKLAALATFSQSVCVGSAQSICARNRLSARTYISFHDFKCRFEENYMALREIDRVANGCGEELALDDRE